MKINESIIQYAIYMKTGKELFTNITVGCNEWDGISISSAGYPTCYEVKISKSDFKADFKKDRHKLLLNRLTQDPDNKYIRLGLLPKYVYYVINGFEIDKSELPDYAGLMIVDSRGFASMKVQAPVLWKEKVSEKRLMNMYKIMGRRYIYKTLDDYGKMHMEWCKL